MVSDTSTSKLVCHARFANYFATYRSFPTLNTVIDWLLEENEEDSKHRTEQLSCSSTDLTLEHAADRIDFLTYEISRLSRAREALAGGTASIFIFVSFLTVDFWLDAINTFHNPYNLVKHKLGGIFLGASAHIMTTLDTVFIFNDFSGILKAGRSRNHATQAFLFAKLFDSVVYDQFLGYYVQSAALRVAVLFFGDDTRDTGFPPVCRIGNENISTLLPFANPIRHASGFIITYLRKYRSKIVDFSEGILQLGAIIVNDSFHNITWGVLEVVCTDKNFLPELAPLIGHDGIVAISHDAFFDTSPDSLTFNLIIVKPYVLQMDVLVRLMRNCVFAWVNEHMIRFRASVSSRRNGGPTTLIPFSRSLGPSTLLANTFSPRGSPLPLGVSPPGRRASLAPPLSTASSSAALSGASGPVFTSPLSRSFFWTSASPPLPSLMPPGTMALSLAPSLPCSRSRPRILTGVIPGLEVISRPLC
jgi:hypothetical protein